MKSKMCVTENEILKFFADTNNILEVYIFVTRLKSNKLFY